MRNWKQSRHEIRVFNARENNLKNLTLSLPRNSFVLLTGLSGSGKSTLVNQVIANEAKRRYLEQLNPKVRSLMAGIKRPEIDAIDGLVPVISIDQVSSFHQIRSTVGTLTGLYDHFRLLFARYGVNPSDSNQRMSRSGFSFNLDEGKCPHCQGIGEEEFIDPATFILHPEKSIQNGALSLTTPTGYVIYSQVTLEVLSQICLAEGFSIDIPWNELTNRQKEIIFYGSQAIRVPFGKHTLESRMKWSGITAKPREEGYYRGILTIMEEILKRDRNKNILKYTKSRECPACQGFRLNQHALSFLWHSKHIGEWAAYPINQLVEELTHVHTLHSLTDGEREIIDTVCSQGQAIVSLGIGHLSLNREARTLSQGENKRLKISSLLRPGMSGLMYTLDEPTVGLHPADHQYLLQTLKDIQHQGNTIICIDHKLFSFYHADHWIEMGEGAGKNGGEILLQGDMHAVIENDHVLQKSVTWPYLTGRKRLHRPRLLLKDENRLTIGPASKNNLKHIRPAFYKNCLNTICGVSGAGKSSLAAEIVAEMNFRKVIRVNQQPIGRSPRSNPVTYTKIFDKIRDVFAQTPEAKQQGLTKSHFSFNVEGGRCPVCLGAGKVEIGLSYLGKSESDCVHCRGKRFHEDVLQIRYNGLTISDVLNLEIDQACAFFSDQDKIVSGLSVLNELGLGYLQLGQSSTSLSGGEAQRIKLANELLKGKGGDNLYLLDEPTNGLHYEDIQIILNGFQKLLEIGNTLIVIEHDPFLVALSDWIVELGPGSGPDGGEIVFMGSPADLKKAHTLMGKAIIEAHSFALPRPEKMKVSAVPERMILKDIRTNNLKGIAVDIPFNQITAISGVSGSGKTSLAFDTLFDLSTFLYAQIFSTYIRTLISGNKPAKVGNYQHILPAIAIRYQQNNSSNLSTVGSLLGLFPVLRLLFSRFSLDASGNPCDLWARHFSYMDASGACQECEGLGFILTTKESLMITDPEKSLAEGAMNGTKPGLFFSDPHGQHYAIFLAMAKENGIAAHRHWKAYTKKEKDLILFGTGEKVYEVLWNFNRKGRKGEHLFQSTWPGFIPLINTDFRKKKGTTRTKAFADLMQETACPVCEGYRLLPDRQTYTLARKTMADWSAMSLLQLDTFLGRLEMHPQDLSEQSGFHALITDLIKKMRVPVQRAINLELGYLTLLRSAHTLSSGEFQRVRLIGQLSSGLSGLLYIIDEPGATLSEENLQPLIQLFEELKAAGNTIVFADHRKELLQIADKHIVLGPVGGSQGGYLLTDPALSPKKNGGVFQRQSSFRPDSTLLQLHQVNDRNLNIDYLHIPNGWVSISGVSGSGKSSLVNGPVVDQLTREGYSVVHAGMYYRQWNWTHMPIRELGLADRLYTAISETEEARKDSIKPADFKPGSKVLGCSDCQGRGFHLVSLDFLGESRRVCSSCGGSGYAKRAKRYRLSGLDIAEIFQLDLGELMCLSCFSDISIVLKETLGALGLNYLTSGQHGNTLSSGEKQRILLTSNLFGGKKEPKVFVFDEPTRGLHPDNKSGYQQLVYALREKGHAFITVDHDREMIRAADWNIVLGPGAGEDGGKVVYEGLPR